MRNALAGVLFALAGTQAQACSCARLAPEGFRASADVILYGRVISVDRSGASTGKGIRAKIRVLHPVKGKTARIITVLTAPHSAACGVEMVEGRGAEYLLNRRGSVYSTNLCLMMGSKAR